MTPSPAHDDLGFVPDKHADIGFVPSAQPAKEQPATSPRTWLDSAGDFLKGAWHSANPVSAVQGLANAAAHPIDTVKAIGANQDALRLKAEAAFKQGNYAEGMRHSLGYLLPVIGPQIDAMGDKAQQGHVAESLGEAAGLAAPMAWGMRPAGAAPQVRIPISSSLNPVEQSAVAAAAREGVAVDLGTATGNPFVRTAQETLEKLPATSSRARRARQAQDASLQQAGQNIANRVYPNSVDDVAAGESVASATQERVGRLNDVADKSYGEFRRIASDPQNVKQVQTGTRASTALNANGNPISVPVMEDVALPTDYARAKAQIAPVVAQLEKTIPEAQRQASPGFSLLKQIMDRPDVVDVNTAMKDLSAMQNIARVSTELPEVRGVSKGLATSVVPTLREAVDAAVSAGGPRAEQVLNRGRAATKAKYDTNDVFSALPHNATGEIEPAQIVQRLTRNHDQSLEMLRSVQQTAPKAIPTVARAYVDNLLDNMVYQGDVRRAQSAVRAWHNLGDETKGILFPEPAVRQSITDFVNYAEMMTRRSNPSGTSSSLAAIASIVNPKLLAMQMLGGKPASDILFGPGGYQLAQRGIPFKLLPSPRGAVSNVAAGAGATNALNPLSDGLIDPRR